MSHSWKWSNQIGWCSEQSDLVEDVATHGREVVVDELYVSLPNQIIP